MDEGKDMEDSTDKRASKLTGRAMEDRISRFIATRRGKLSQLTTMMKTMETLKLDASNVNVVEEMLRNNFCKAMKEFEEINAEVVALLDEDERQADQQNWFEPKSAPINDFVENTDNWLSVMWTKIREENVSASEYPVVTLSEDDVRVEDSVSQIHTTQTTVRSKSGSNSGRKSLSSSESSRSAVTRVSSARIKEEAERAALIARSAALKEKQALEIEAAQLKAKREIEEAEIKAKRDQLDVDAAIAASNAKIKVLKEYDGSDTASKRSLKRSGAGLVLNTALRSPVPSRTVQPAPNTQHDQSHDNGYSQRHAASRPVPFAQNLQPDRSHDYSQSLRHVPSGPVQHAHDQRQVNTQVQSRNDESELCRIMQRQNVITEMLVKQQAMSNLPSKDIPVFTGDPLTYKSFIRAFEHAVDSKIDGMKDKLYYLEQYTSGEPQELVRSCEHMSSDRAYNEARRLLQRHYGDELKIANAYLDKALKWPQIKSEDGKALRAYALFLVGCRNTMDDIEFMEEMDNPTNMRVVVSKLPYKLKEKWRTTAFEIHEKGRGRARFSNLVDFIDRQAKVALDPLFGEVVEKHQTTEKENNTEKGTIFGFI